MTPNENEEEEDDSDQIDSTTDNKFSQNDKSKSSGYKLSVTGGQEFLNDKMAKKKNDETFACPIFDKFLQAFIITKDYHSFYMDLTGVYDFDFRKIPWSSKVLKI